MNPSTAFGATFTDELVRCGLREVVLAPGSRSTPLAMAFAALENEGRLRLHVRIDERSVSFTALGLAKSSGRPVTILCTSGTAAANFHPAVIEADESCVPLLVLTADRPPELRGTGANQAIDQIKLYGDAVRWFCEAGVPERGDDSASAYWRSLAGNAWARAAGIAGGLAGPVHLNLALREPLVPDGPAAPLPGRPDGAPWTRFPGGTALAGGAELAKGAALAGGTALAGILELPWTERGVVLCGDGAEPVAGELLTLAERAGWPVLAEPSSGARRGPAALSAYQYLLGRPEFRPDLIVSAGRPGLSRAQQSFLASADRHVVIAQGPGRWADPQRTATDVAGRIRLTGVPGAATADAGAPGDAEPAGSGGASWPDRWLDADRRVRGALDRALDTYGGITEPRLARDLVAALPEGALLWLGSSMPIRDADSHMPARDDIRVLASRGASGIDGTVSAAAGAALGHDGPAFALIGDLTFLHDVPSLALGPHEPRPDLCLIVVNNDGGGIFSTLEQAAFDGFERLFGTPHGAGIRHLAAAFGLQYHFLDHPEDLTKLLQGSGLRIIEARTDRAAGADVRAHLRAVANAAL